MTRDEVPEQIRRHTEVVRRLREVSSVRATFAVGEQVIHTTLLRVDFPVPQARGLLPGKRCPMTFHIVDDEALVLLKASRKPQSPVTVRLPGLVTLTGHLANDPDGSRSALGYRCVVEPLDVRYLDVDN